ncbi:MULTISPECIES: serine hydrolase domain-containing protein [unclassified Microbacterium]|uniref:serine hydrolase domain-containing protein n=1 Tax=unclassified Microbacterium TaxID=2609290 RepID=UPI0030104CE7
MRRTRIAAAGAVIIALALTGCAPESTPAYTPAPQVEGALPEDLQTQLHDAVAHAMAASGSSGAVVGVWAPWSGSWVTGIGTAGPGDETPASTDMAFRIGDVTRLMTCDVLYALADRGTVALEDSVTTWVAGVPDLADVTLLDLCNGTSGLGLSSSIAESNWLSNPTRMWNPKELASYGMEQQRTAPGGGFRDSDAAYLLLGQALERASGQSAASLIRTYVTGPLGLNSTSLPSARPAAPSDGPVLAGTYAPRTPEGGYDCAAPVDVTVSSASIGFTDSGVVSTIEDLGRFAQAEAKQALRTKDEPARFGAPLPAYDGAPSWFQATGGGYLVGTMVGQQGWAPGYLTAAYSDPASGFTVAVVLNGSSGGGALISALAFELAAIGSKAPAAKGATAPEFGLPFTAEQYHEVIGSQAICPVDQPAAEESAGEDEGEGDDD